MAIVEAAIAARPHGGPTEAEIAATAAIVFSLLRAADESIEPDLSRRIGWGQPAFTGPRSWRRAA